MKCCVGLQNIMSPNEIKPRNQVIQSRKCYPLGHVVASKGPTADLAVFQTAFLFDLQINCIFPEKVVVQFAIKRSGDTENC